MVSPAIQNLARQFIALEAASREPHDATSHDDAVTRAIEKLRARLIRLAGIDGFRSLLSRALNLAKAEAPALSKVSVSADGLVRGFGEMVRAGTQTESAEQAGTVLVAHFLELLVAFIGEPLTLHLVRDVWPEASANGVHLNTIEEQQ